MSQPPRTRPTTRRVSSGSQPPPPSRRSNAPPRRDPFPYILGGILTVVLVGVIFVVVFLLAQNQTDIPPGAQATATPPVIVEGITPGVTTVSTDVTPPPEATAGDPPPRMPLADFKALYDDPAKRPLVIDVRAKDAFDAGHIKGSESWPESDIDARVVKLPKDKLIVAYCQ